MTTNARTRRGRRHLEDHRAGISRCVRCGACSAVCPSFLADRRESRSPRGRIALIEAVLDGRLAVSKVFRDRLATCTGCLACEARCASGVPVPAIVQAAKADAVSEAGPGLLTAVIAATLRQPLVLRSLAWLAPVALHYAGEDMRGTGPKQDRRSRSARQGQTRSVLFFPGCAIEHFQQDIEQAVVAVLEQLGYTVIVPEGLACCGRPFLSLGDLDAARDAAERTAAVLGSVQAEAIVTACASCGLTFKTDYPALLARSGLRLPAVLDIHEFLADKMDRLDLEALPGRVTVHDPCHLGRGQGLAGTVRAVLAAVPGLDLAEMREPEQCCGFGGVMRATHPDLSRAIGSAKANDIVGTGAPLAVTGCPGCRMQLSDALRRKDAPVEVVHTVQVIAKALGARSQEPAAGRRAVLRDSGS